MNVALNARGRFDASGTPGAVESGTDGAATSRFVYLPQLDGLRFLAALMVIVHHLPRPEQAIVAVVATFGWVGVDLFFVLSSYLIFSLLFREQVFTGKISVLHFYIRRALRIWPLYFGYLAVFVILPACFLPRSDAIAQHLLPMLTFSGNLSYMLFPSTALPSSAHLWTISLEEQFYAIAPLLAVFGLCFRRYAWVLAVAAVAFSVGARWYVLTNELPFPVVWVFTLCRLDPFVVGAALAVLLHARPELQKAQLGWFFALLSLAGFALVMNFPQVGQSMHTTWQLTATALASGCLVLAALLPRGLARPLSGAVLPYLGKISFGIYVFHMLARDMVQIVLPGAAWWLIFASSLGVTIVCAHASYQIWERPFLRLKRRYECVGSRPL